MLQKMDSMCSRVYSQNVKDKKTGIQQIDLAENLKKQYSFKKILFSDNWKKKQKFNK